MALIKTYDESNAQSLDGVSIEVFNSSGKQLGGAVADNNGSASIEDWLLSDKSGTIKFTRVEYQPLSIAISKFNGNAFLKPKDVTLGNVIVKSRKKVILKNPFETSEKTPTPAQSNVKESKKIPAWIPIVGGGVLIAVASYFIFKPKA